MNTHRERSRRIGREGIAALAAALVVAVAVATGAGEVRASEGESPSQPRLLERPPVQARLSGPVGERVRAVIDQWIIPAPKANPAMLEMFRLRDRSPRYENPVPWAGEFAGKYLTSAVLLNRMVDDPALDEHLRQFVAELLATQADDGYMGPFRKDERLLGHWDLWGHYHAMMGLYLWHEAEGDEAAFDAAVRVADLICDIYVDGDREVHDAGSHEMNMAVIHVFGKLHRKTGDERYLELMRQIERGWEQPPAGDYLRTGLAGVPFHETPKPRWESLHPMQGMTELFRITGDERYRTAVLHHWHSIAETDVHNAGSFSTEEQAVGNPFRDGAIETCCTVAWLAYSVDALRLSGDSVIADELERATYNAVLSFLHPSGRWATYHTPMDGRREASAHSIVFQARPGTPELNCCSVNAPRGLGMITDWAVLSDEDGVYINYYGPGRIDAALADGTWRFEQQTQYPADGRVRMTVTPPRATEQTLRLRIPSWSKQMRVAVNGEAVEAVEPGKYLAIDRTWEPGDVITLEFDMSVRSLRGDHHVDYRTSLFRGPILLTYDQKFNALDPDAIAAIDLESLSLEATEAEAATHEPIVHLAATTVDGSPVNLVDYGTAGAHGSTYRSWLEVVNAPPPPFFLKRPGRGSRMPAGSQLLLWSPAGPKAEYRVRVARDEAMEDVVYAADAWRDDAELLLDETTLEPGERYYWEVTARSEGRQWSSTNGPVAFSIDGDTSAEKPLPLIKTSPGGGIDRSIDRLREPLVLKMTDGPGGRRDTAVQLPADEGRLVYEIDAFPADRYTFAAWFRADAAVLQAEGWRQIVSAWRAPSDDPLRISCWQGRLTVSVENHGAVYRIPGGEIEPGVWTHVALVKDGRELRLYVNGRYVDKVATAETLPTQADSVGIGSNPNFGDAEAFEGAIADVMFTRGVMSDGDILTLYRESR